MQVIKLNATDSTNTYLKKLGQTVHLSDYTVVVAAAQLKGKGQLGAIWQSEPGKNLTFSLLKKFDNLAVNDCFLVNICISLAISNCLKEYSVPDVSIKWPNDILSGTTKICGILIENLIQSNQIKSSIIGVGLNVNQVSFTTLANASSLKLLLGKTFNLDELQTRLLYFAKNYFSMFDSSAFDQLRNEYQAALFRKDKPSTFMDQNGKRFMGFIRGVSVHGKLLVELEGAITQEFDLKQLRLLY